MTAEIAILNRSGIALAADSAVTIGRERVWKYSNKLFSLGPHNDIGIMIYGSGDFLGFHWEIVIKSFREHIGSKTFSTVSDCCDEFKSFLLDERWSDEFSESLAVSSIFYQAIERLKINLEYENIMDFRKNIISLINIENKNIENNVVCIPDITKDDFNHSFGDQIKKLAADILDQHLTKPIQKSLIDYLYNFFIRAECRSNFETGVVFAGYGKSEYFPVIIHNIVDGKIDKFIRMWLEDQKNFNTDRKSRGVIVPFAQSDMTHLFMEGIGIEQIDFIGTMILEILSAKSDDMVKNYISDEDERVVEAAIQRIDNNKLADAVLSKFKKYRYESLVSPMMKVVSALPREEMADMAEALVELTSLRRKIDSRLESVGGPIDVAIISKGDGFIWIKRKNYFESALNMDYKKRRAIRVYGGDHEEG